MTIVATYFKEEGMFRARAEVVRLDNGTHKIDYYDINGEFVQSETLSK